MSPLRHDTSGRSLRAGLIVLAVWGAVLCLWRFLDLAPLFVALLMAVTLPAAWDFATDRRAWLHLDDSGLSWGSGRATGEVALARIDRVRFETRLDLSIRVRIVLENGRRITLPQDSLPSSERLQAAFEARGIQTERHHFSLM